jgi:hypothetical protein
MFGSTVEVPTHSLQFNAEYDAVWTGFLHREPSRAIRKLTVLNASQVTQSVMVAADLVLQKAAIKSVLL